jgi:tRNA threonylcarbamoyladenosine biosynthesis protein TsaB
MKVLAVETSGQAGSIAVLNDDHVVQNVSLPPNERSATTLAPAIREILKDAGLNVSEIELIAVTIGPGSFTGLRVGVTTAKTLAYALSADVIGVGTLDLIAAQSDVSSGRLSVAMDAQREQVYACEFQRDADEYRVLGAPVILDNDAWIAGLKPGTAVSGPALEKLAARIPAHATMVPSDRWSPRAATVGQLGWRRHRSGERDDLWRIVPNYFRLSAAEEKLATRRPPPAATR